MFILLYTWGCLEISTVPNYFLLMKNFDMKILSVDFFSLISLMKKNFLQLFRDLVAELPFTLMHPKPLDDDDRPSSSSSHKSESR